MSSKNEMAGNPQNRFLLEKRASTILYNFLLSNISTFPYLLPANICPIVLLTFFKAGQTFQLMDIDPATFSMDKQLCLDLARKNRIGGILYVHTYGETATQLDFFSTLKSIDSNIFVIDDQCLCEPGFSQPPMNDVDLILYSTGYGKFVDIGAGGFGWIKPQIVYQQTHLPFERVDLEKLEKDYKSSIQNRYPFRYHDSHWLDTRTLDMDIRSFSNIILDILPEIQQKKVQINQIYREQLPKEIQLPDIYNQWRFNIQVPNKTEVLQAIFDNQLFASSHYASLGGIMSEGAFPFAEALHDHIINLFNDHHYSIEQAEKTALIVKNILRKGIENEHRF
jgi:hypothetical protein